MNRRRGTASIMVVAITGMAGVTALAGMFLLAAQRRIIELQADAGAARAIAMSGAERACAIIQAEPGWRWNRPSGVWISSAPLGGGVYTVEVTDPVDGDFTDNEGDPVRIVARATVGAATQIVMITLEPKRDATESLRWGVFAGGDIDAGLLSNLTAGTDVRAGGSVSANGANVWPRVVASGSVSGLTYYGGTAQGAPAVSGPDPSLIDEYVARGTRIGYNSLSSGRLERAVLSPALNPLGAASGGAGIYYIECANRDVEVRRFRMLGTLVLLDPGPGSRISESVRFDPAVEGYPSLLVRGSILMDTTTSALSESGEDVNFNPPGAPFAGVTDNDKLDTYPTRFTGAIYTTGGLTVSGTLRASAPIIAGGSLSLRGSIESSYSEGDLELAPPGFGGALRLEVDPEGVWRAVQ